MRQNIRCILPVLLALLAGVTRGQQRRWSGCQGANDKLRIGEPARVCIQVANGVNWGRGVQYVRGNFEPNGDEYSRLHIPNSYRDLVRRNSGSIFAGNNVTVGAASQNSLSFLRLFYDVDKERVYPFLTAIIDVNKGVVSGITWDNACGFCGGFADACEENTYNYNGIPQDAGSAKQETKACYSTLRDCDEALAADPDSHGCDLTMYVVWTGTDVDGKALQSQAYRFSEFPAQGLADRFTQAIPTFGLENVDLPDVPRIPFTGGDDEDEDEEGGDVRRLEDSEHDL